MKAITGKANLALIAIVMLFGLNMFLAATNVTRWAAEESLSAFVDKTVANWSERMQPKLDTALAGVAGEPSVDDLRRIFAEAVPHVGIEGYRYFDRAGKMALVDGEPPQLAMASLAANSEPVIQGSGQMKTGASGAIDDTRRMVSVDLPVRHAGDVIGRLRLYVDQSGALQLFYSSHEFVAMLSALFLLGAVSVLIVVIWVRVKEQAQSDERVRYLAHHDALTDLPNREFFMKHFEFAVERVKKGDEMVALLCLDIDQFKRINDTMGHAIGDTLIKEFADRLRRHIRKTDLICRLGGDEFVIALTGLKSFEKVAPFAERLRETLARPYDIAGQTFTASASIGISLSPNDGSDPDTLLKYADLALYRAKADGRNTVRLYEPEMDAAFQRRIQLGVALRTALDNGEFRLFYQPQLDMDSGVIYGREALVRWYHPVKGVIPPDEFIPVAQETGLIIPLSKWILETACSDAMSWEDKLKVAVNMSPLQFKTGCVADLVEDTLDATGLEPGRLELEITETLLMSDTASVMNQLQRLKSLGVSIVMDDFGTGYSSLSYLASFPFDKIKIDRSFIERLNDDGMVDTIVSSIINLSHNLGIVPVAEGVETEKQETVLKRYGCKYAQGFLYGKPKPIDGEDAAAAEEAAEQPAAGAAAVDPAFSPPRLQ